jgi:5'-deoxynucleotidase
MLPSELRSNYHPLIFPNDGEPELELVKAADKISAYLKCLQELKHGNTDFQKAEKTLKKRLAKIQLPEVKYFMDKFLPSYSLTIDELNDDNS